MEKIRYYLTKIHTVLNEAGQWLWSGIKAAPCYARTFIVGCITGILTTCFVIHAIQPKAATDSKPATSQTVSGAPLTVKSITSKDKVTTVDATYSGAGESKIDIPDNQIPAANAWNTYHWGIGGMISTNLTYNIIGSYRYERVMGLASVWAKNANGYDFGLSAGAMWLF